MRTIMEWGQSYRPLSEIWVQHPGRKDEGTWSMLIGGIYMARGISGDSQRGAQSQTEDNAIEG